MARRRKMDPERKAFINSLLEHYQPKDAQDIQDMLKDLLGETLQGMLEAEMDDHLGYSKYDYKNKETDDSRNGYSPKTVTSSMGTIDLDIPRDRKGDFEPQIVKKNQTDISNIEDQVLSMYAKGMTTRDISAHPSLNAYINMVLYTNYISKFDTRFFNGELKNSRLWIMHGERRNIIVISSKQNTQYEFHFLDSQGNIIEDLCEDEIREIQSKNIVVWSN